MNNLATICDSTVEEQEKFLIESGANLTRWKQMEDFSIMAQAEVLYYVWSVWEAGNNHENLFIRDEAKAPWNYDFYRWAKVYSRTQTNLEPAEETINNKITIYRDWVAEGLIEHPETVFISKRDIYGNPTNEWEEVEFNPLNCGYGKLLISRGTARKGEMTPDAWSALSDPYTTVRELKSAIKGDVQKENNQDDFSIYEQDGIIYGYSKGRKVPVLQALFENSSDELFNRTLSHILHAAGIKVPVGYI